MDALTVGYRDALDRLPVCDADAWLAGRELVVVSPHPDDESLGAGGLIASAAATGHAVTIVFLTDGEHSHVGSLRYPPYALANLRRREAMVAADLLGAGRVTTRFLGLPDSGLAALPEERIEAIIHSLAACVKGHRIACVTASTDPHADHQAAHAWMREACRRAGTPLWSYPVWTWMLDDEALPQVAPEGVRIPVDAPQLAAKRRAIAAHRSQHGLVVTDAEDAFVLPDALVQHMCRAHEVFLHA